MRLLATISNLLVVGLLIFGLFEDGGAEEPRMIAVFLLVAAIPIVNLIALHTGDEGGGALKAYLERKKLENQAKSRQLREDLDQI